MARKFNLMDAMAGVPIRTVGGTPLRYVAFIPDAEAHEQLVLFNQEAHEVQLHHADGAYHVGRTPCTLDAVTP